MDFILANWKLPFQLTQSCGYFTTLPKNDNTKLLITSAAAELTATSEILATIRAEVIRLAKQLPENEIVMAMYGVVNITGAQLMAEIGDGASIPESQFAGVDPEVNQSGKQNTKSNATTKRGSPHLRKTLYQIICTYLMCSPTDEPVYQFLDKKRTEGKPYFVNMTAASNKLLRIYYAKVKERLSKLDAKAYLPPIIHRYRPKIEMSGANEISGR
ncbi:MAG: transposase [Clostridia bacterium]|nr:transposase [Clostridia bacterium]